MDPQQQLRRARLFCHAGICCASSQSGPARAQANQSNFVNSAGLPRADYRGHDASYELLAHQPHHLPAYRAATAQSSRAADGGSGSRRAAAARVDGKGRPACGQRSEALSRQPAAPPGGAACPFDEEYREDLDQPDPDRRIRDDPGRPRPLGGGQAPRAHRGADI